MKELNVEEGDEFDVYIERECAALRAGADVQSSAGEGLATTKL